MDIKNVIKLSDGAKYIVVNQIEFENSTYLQLLKVDEESSSIIVKKENNEVTLITDTSLLAKILVAIGNNIIDNFA